MMIPFSTGVTCSLPAEDLSKILNGISDDTFTIEVEENKATLISENTTAELSTEVDSRIVEDYFAAINFDDMDWQGVPENFLDQLALARFSVSSNAMDSNNLHCVYVNGKTMCSGDGHRLSRLSLGTPMDEVLIPGTAISDILSFKDFDQYAISNGWIHLENPEGIIVSCRTILGEYPNFSPIFEQFEEKSKVQVESSLIPVLQNLTSLVAGDSDFMKAVTIDMKKGTTVLTGTKEGLKIEKKATNNYKGSPVSFMISPAFLAHILTMTEELSIGETSALFESDTFSHIVQLPLR